jgi:hypothetical protein
MSKSKERMITINTTGGALNGIPVIQFLVAKQGLQALNRGMRLNRFATPKRCMEIISSITGYKYKRTERNVALRDAEVVEHLLQEARKQLIADRELV